MTVDASARSSAPSDAIGDLLDQAVGAVNRGDLAAAHDLAGRVLAEDEGNREASDLLATDEAPAGELRRLTIMACDLVGSTGLSERLDPERYRELVGGYRRRAREIIEGRYDGHIVSVKGDGIFALFGYPTAHEEDATRAVKASLDVCRVVQELSAESQASTGEALSVRAAVHRGLVLIDLDEDDVYGLAANVASRLEGLAAPGRVVISEEIRRVVVDRFDIEPGELRSVKGVAVPVPTYTVVSERPESAKLRWGGPLVGRDAELEVLRAAWSTARRGTASRAQSVLLQGEAGIGKSRLAAALADEVRADGALVVELTGSSFHRDAGLHPVQRLLEARCGIASDAPADERLARLRQELGAAGQATADEVALLAPVLGLSPEAGYEPVTADGRKLNEDITRATKDYLLSTFGGGAGMLLVEDLQWFDDSTLALVTDLLGAPHGELLVVLTARDGVPLATGTTLELGPLTTDDCIVLIDALDDRALDRRARQALVDRSDGIPLYLEELLRGGAALTTEDRGDVPDVLYEPLVARLYTTAHGVPVAATAATIGRDVDRALLADAVDMSEAELDAELAALVEGKVLATVGDAGRFRFRHELLREVAYELQPPSQRRRVHGRVADLLVAGAPAADLIDWPVVAGHFEQAHRLPEAAHAYELAADRARARGAIPEARTHLGRAIELIDRDPEDRERMHQEVELRLRRGFLAMSAEGAGSADAAADFARCLALAMVDAQGDEMFSTLISLWAYHLSRAELDRAKQVLDTLRPSLTGSRAYFRAANRAGYGMIQWFEGDFRGALPVLEEAMAESTVDAAREVDAVWFVPNDPTASMHTHLALARFMTGDTAGAEAQLALTDKVTAGLAFPQGAWSHAYASWLGTWMRAERGDFAGALAASDELVGLAARHGFDSWSMIGMTNQAAVQASMAAGSAASTPADAAVHASTLATFVGMWQMVELQVFLPYYLTATAAALAASGDAASARERCSDAVALAERTGMRFYEAETRRRLALLAEDDATAITQLQAALLLAREQGAVPFQLRIALDLYERGAADSRDALEVAASAFPPDADLADLARARTLLTANA